MAEADIFGYKQAVGMLGCGNSLKKIERHLFSFRSIAPYTSTNQIIFGIVTAPGNRQDMIYRCAVLLPTVSTDTLISGNDSFPNLFPLCAVLSSL